MSDAPERVWLHPDGQYITAIPTEHGFTEYIRADIHEWAQKQVLSTCEVLDEENAHLREALQDIHMMVADDASAITYQTIGQYRTALLAAIRTHLEDDDE